MCAGGPGFTSAAGSPRFRAADEPCTPTLTGANDLHTLRGAIDLRTGAANVRSMSVARVVAVANDIRVVGGMFPFAC